MMRYLVKRTEVVGRRTQGGREGVRGKSPWEGWVLR